ncbi:MAG: hypothetical protein LBH33_04705 [Endomicrobium sp.]|nr:hypothetical protein [Endomicrobium sp.]
MKKLVLVVMICCAFAVSGSHAFDMECDRQCHICDEMYKLRVRLGGEYLKEALEYCLVMLLIIAKASGRIVGKLPDILKTTTNFKP